MTVHQMSCHLPLTPDFETRFKMLELLVLGLVVTTVTSQDGRPITTCCDGYQAPGAVRNGTCRQVTYNVQQMYQACPPKGTVIEVDKPDTSGTPSTNSRLSQLENKLTLLENLVIKLSANRAVPSAGRPEVPREAVHNVTKAGGTYPVDCTELFSLGYRATGVYLIQPAEGSRPFQAFCELAYEGWTVITRRFDGSVDFYRKWADYKLGFGTTPAEHWLGNDRIHLLTNQKNYRLRVEFTRWSDGLRYYADYSRFKIESEAAKYKLHITGYSGNSGHDGLTPHNTGAFSTWDRDNDLVGSHEAQVYKGAFWYIRGHSHSVATALYQQNCGGYVCMSWGAGVALKELVWKVKSI